MLTLAASALAVWLIDSHIRRRVVTLRKRTLRDAFLAAHADPPENVG